MTCLFALKKGILLFKIGFGDDDLYAAPTVGEWWQSGEARWEEPRCNWDMVTNHSASGLFNLKAATGATRCYFWVLYLLLLLSTLWTVRSIQLTFRLMNVASFPRKHSFIAEGCYVIGHALLFQLSNSLIFFRRIIPQFAFDFCIQLVNTDGALTHATV